MKKAIIYVSKHGTTEKITQMIKKEINGADLINLKKKSDFDLSKYDLIILGGSIYLGSISSILKRFIKKNIEKIYEKKIALFIVCIFEGEIAKKQFDDNFPELLRKKSIANGFFGGELVTSKLSTIEKIIVWTVKKNTKERAHINEEEIKRFIHNIKKKSKL
jgi:menaquinone-dependent protoporphyrinogen oxidase